MVALVIPAVSHSVPDATQNSSTRSGAVRSAAIVAGVGDLAIGQSIFHRTARAAAAVARSWRNLACIFNNEAEQAGAVRSACIGKAWRLPARTIARHQRNPVGKFEVGPVLHGKPVHQVAPEPIALWTQADQIAECAGAIAGHGGRYRQSEQ